MQNSMVIFILFVLDWKYHFWTNMVQKIKIVSLSWNLGPLLIRICTIQWLCSLFCFRPQTPFLGKFGPKSKSCQFKLKFGTWTNSNMQNSMVVFTFSVSDKKHPFWSTKVNEVGLLSLRPYGSRDFEKGSCRQNGFFILLRWVRPWIAFGHCLKNFK